MELSVVIPAFNEAGNLKPLLHEINQALAKLDYELIVVDDGSTDGTFDTLLEARTQGLSRLCILHHRVRCGQSGALLTGVRQAQAEWIVTLDADGQNDPADISKLLARLREGVTDPRPTLITGLRRRRQDPGLKRLASRVANGVRSRLLKDHIPDTGCGLKLFSRTAFLALPQFDHMHRFLPALFQRLGARVEAVEVNHRPRREGVSKYGIHNRLWVGIVDLMGVMWLERRSLRPEVAERVGDEPAAGLADAGASPFSQAPPAKQVS